MTSSYGYLIIVRNHMMIMLMMLINEVVYDIEMLNLIIDWFDSLWSKLIELLFNCKLVSTYLGLTTGLKRMKLKNIATF